MEKKTLRQWVFKELTFSNVIILGSIIFAIFNYQFKVYGLYQTVLENNEQIKMLQECKLDKDSFEQTIGVTNNRLEAIEKKLDKLQYYLMERK